MLATGWSAPGRDLAETLAALTLAPLIFDVVERPILDPDAKVAPLPMRAAWYAAVATLPVVVRVLEEVFTDGMAGSILDYASRTVEAFLFALLMGAYSLLPTDWSVRRRPRRAPVS